MNYTAALSTVMKGNIQETYKGIDIQKSGSKFTFKIGKTHVTTCVNDARRVIDQHYSSLAKSIS